MLSLNLDFSRNRRLGLAVPPALTLSLLALAMALVMALYAPASQAQNPDDAGTAQPVQVSADHALFSQAPDKAGFSRAVYSGQAELQHGTRSLHAERIELFIRDQQIVKMVATGSAQKPARMIDAQAASSQPERADGTSPQPLNASAITLEYHTREERLTLVGDARIEHNGRLFEGATIDYHLTDKQVEASGGEDQRVRLVLPGEMAPDAEPEAASGTAPQTQQEPQP